LRQLCADYLVKAFGDDSAVKGFDFKIKFVFQFSQFYFTGLVLMTLTWMPLSK